MKKSLFVAASAIALTATVASAQGNSGNGTQAPSEQDLLSAGALMATPVGALPPIATGRYDGSTAKSWHVTYGRMSFNGTDESRNSFATGVDFGFGAGRVGVTLGMNTYSCEGCDSDLMAGVRYGTDIMQRNELHIGLDGNLGYGKIDEDKVLSISANAPVVYNAESGNMKIMPFIAPGLGWGRYSVVDAESYSGTHFLLGAGVGVGFQNGLGVNVGMQKVFIEDGDTEWGLGFTYRFGQKAAKASPRRRR